MEEVEEEEGNTPMSDNLEGCVCVMTAEGGGMHIQRNNILPRSVTRCRHELPARLFFDAGTLETSGCLCAGPELSALPY